MRICITFANNVFLLCVFLCPIMLHFMILMLLAVAFWSWQNFIGFMNATTVLVHHSRVSGRCDSTPGWPEPAGYWSQCTLVPQ